MCFSPEADLVGGVIVGAVGVDALRHCRRHRDLPLVSLPLLLGAHQLVETFVWWGSEGRVGQDVGQLATLGYLWFAFCILPVLVPAAVAAIEPTRRRRWAMAPFVLAGLAVAVVLGKAIVAGPVTAEAASNHMVYDVGHIPAPTFVVSTYVAATCVPLFLSSYRHVAAFGVANLAAAIALTWMIPRGFTSVWCAWAAVTAAATAFHIRVAHTRRPRWKLREQASPP